MSALTTPRVRCLGCTMPEHSADGMVHRCAGDTELAPCGGHCQCDRPGCGPRRPRT